MAAPQQLDNQSMVKTVGVVKDCQLSNTIQQVLQTQKAYVRSSQGRFQWLWSRCCLCRLRKSVMLWCSFLNSYGDSQKLALHIGLCGFPAGSSRKSTVLPVIFAQCWHLTGLENAYQLGFRRSAEVNHRNATVKQMPANAYKSQPVIRPTPRTCLLY